MMLVPLPMYCHALEYGPALGREHAEVVCMNVTGEVAGILYRYLPGTMWAVIMGGYSAMSGLEH